MLRVVKVGGSLLLRPSLLDDLNAWLKRQPPATNLLLVGGGEMINAVRDWDRVRPGNPAEVHWRCIEMLRYSYHWIADGLRMDHRFTGLECVETGEQWAELEKALNALKANQAAEHALVPKPGSSIRSTRPDTEPTALAAGKVLPFFTPPAASAVGSENGPNLRVLAVSNPVVLLNVPAVYGRGGKLPETWQTTTDAIAIWLAERVVADECVLLKSCPIPVVKGCDPTPAGCDPVPPGCDSGPVGEHAGTPDWRKLDDRRRLVESEILDESSGEHAIWPSSLEFSLRVVQLD